MVVDLGDGLAGVLGNSSNSVHQTQAPSIPGEHHAGLADLGHEYILLNVNGASKLFL